MNGHLDSDYEFAKRLQNEDVEKNVKSLAMIGATSEIRRRPDVVNNHDARLALKLQREEIKRQQQADSLMAEQLTVQDRQNGAPVGAMGGAECNAMLNAYDSIDGNAVDIPPHVYDDQQIAMLLQEQIDSEQDEQDLTMAQQLANEEGRNEKFGNNTHSHNQYGNRSQLFHRVLDRRGRNRRQQGSFFDAFRVFPRFTPPMPIDAHQHSTAFSGFSPSPGFPEFSESPFVEFDPLHQAADNDDQFISITQDPSMLVSLLMTRAPGMMVPDNIDLSDYESLWDLAERLGEVRNCGASKQEIGQLPVRKHRQNDNSNSESDECPICMSKFVDGEYLRTLPCLHAYHKNCIDKWLKRNAVCPVCRKSTKGDG